MINENPTKSKVTNENPPKNTVFFSSKEASLKIFRMTQPGLDTRKKKGCLGKSQP